ncbi:MAG: bestrophin family ion channel [Pseudoxanthomonas sp.]
MHAGRSYKFSEFIVWTRRSLYWLIAYNLIVVALYRLAALQWLAIPWGIVFLLGTTVALTAGFKNTQTYNRTWEAQQIWASIAAMSRIWGSLVRDLTGDEKASRQLVYRHFAWLTALRYQMRESREWETLKKAPNAEYRKNYDVPEKESALEAELSKYVPREEISRILVSSGRATQVLGLQSEALRKLFDAGAIPVNVFIELEKILREFHDQQAKSERIKNYPYPRQYAIVNAIFVRILCLLLPLGMVGEFERMNQAVDGLMQGQMAWLAVPLSVLIGWMYLSLDQVGESSSNPFEGGANDIPITQICASIETDLRQLHGESWSPAAPRAGNPIVL